MAALILMVPERQSPFRYCARSLLRRDLSRELERHRVSSDYGAGSVGTAASIVAMSRHGDLALTVTGAKAIGRTGAGTWRPVC